MKQVLDNCQEKLTISGRDKERAVAEAFVEADKSLAAAFDAKDLDHTSSGTTLVAAFLHEDDLVVASTGDAKIVIGRVKEGDPDVDLADGAGQNEQKPKEGEMRRRSTATEAANRCVLEAEQATVEHKFGDPNEVRRIEEAGGVVEPADGYCNDRIWLDRDMTGTGLQPTRTIGDHAYDGVGVVADPDVSSIKLTKRDKFLILATDGVWEYAAAGVP